MIGIASSLSKFPVAFVVMFMLAIAAPDRDRIAAAFAHIEVNM